ncbi:MAG: hypothetical protein KF819_25640 [Labilithrix sp.]|nr:hypothetical protein [Labilithrix sp.]
MADPDDERSLDELLSETRILLPGTQVLLAFLMTLPFTDRFARLPELERVVYFCTFLATQVALACFVTPASYHRIARPIRDKVRFKNFVNVFLVIGLIPTSISTVLTTFLIASVVAGRAYAYPTAAIVAVFVMIMWWFAPLLRVHERYGGLRRAEAR